MSVMRIGKSQKTLVNQSYLASFCLVLFLGYFYSMQKITIEFEFKVEHNPGNESHLKQIALEWAKSKGAKIVDGKIVLGV